MTRSEIIARMQELVRQESELPEGVERPELAAEFERLKVALRRGDPVVIVIP